MRHRMLYQFIAMVPFVLAVVTIPCMAGQKAVTREVRTQALPGGQVAVPKYHYGFLVFRHMPSAAAPHFSVLDPVEDRIVAQIKAEAPGATETYPIDMAVFPDRSRLVASVATKNLSGKRSLWLLFYSLEGKLMRSEKVTPFHPYQLAVAPDSTIWGLGVNEKTYEAKESAEPVLYQWSETGGVLRTLLAQKDFPEDSPLGEPIIGLGVSRLAVSRDRVVLYAVGSGILTEIGVGGRVLGMHKPARPVRADGKPEQFTGLAVTDEGEIFASIGGVRRFDRATGTWVKVEAPEALAGRHAIYGGAGSQLLLSGESGDRFHFRLVTME